MTTHWFISTLLLDEKWRLFFLYARKLARKYDERFAENVLVVVDDSHGVEACGATGRGTEEHAGSGGPVDVLVATLGKALGVNGGYCVASPVLIEYLSERSPCYIYSNPLTVGEAAAAVAALAVLEGRPGARCWPVCVV